MTLFYKRREEVIDGIRHFYVTVNVPGSTKEIEVDFEVYDLIVSLQREHWRKERYQSYHCGHIEQLSRRELYCNASRKLTPEQQLIRRAETFEFIGALCKLPKPQLRRFYLRYVEELSYRQIADRERCSADAVKQSVALARKNLRTILQSILPE